MRSFEIFSRLGPTTRMLLGEHLVIGNQGKIRKSNALWFMNCSLQFPVKKRKKRRWSHPAKIARGNLVKQPGFITK